MCVTRSHPCTTSTYLGRPPPGDYPLFPGPSEQAIPKQAVIKLFRRVIEQTGATLTRLDPSGQLRQRFHEHVCRVSGAQFRTRLGYNKETVQLVGRWGSEAAAGSGSTYTP